MRIRSTLTALLAAGLVLTAGACDTTEDTALDVFVVDFQLDLTDPDAISDGGDVASFTTDDVVAPGDRDDLRDALRTAGSGALVVAYIQSSAVFDGVTTTQTYSALPLSRGYEAVLDDGTPYVDYTVGYEYSFDNQDFYFDVTSSAAVLESELAVILPAAPGFRVVVIPDELYLVNGRAGARVDLRDYEAVKAAYGLPD